MYNVSDTYSGSLGGADTSRPGAAAFGARLESTSCIASGGAETSAMLLESERAGATNYDYIITFRTAILLSVPS
jgi:hypothetical protein